MGAATAARLFAAGARVLTAQRRTSEHETIAPDLADPTAPSRIIEEVRTRAGRLDILVNSAGIMREGTVEQTPEADWHLQLQVNLTAPFLLIRHAMPLLRAAKGVVINIGSIEGLASNPRHPAYCASKAGLHALTRAVAVDHGPDGVRCNAVAPGWIDTELTAEYAANFADPGFHARLGSIHPVGRTGTPEEVANLIVWLASEEAAFVTGQTFSIDGGRTAKLSLP
jgi:meso-butanediol dehydrogenase / (S,S)-butanediol dehydrogenase / diacetyl reductase